MAIYMKISNTKQPINGDVTATGYEQWIEVEAMNFGVGRAITMEAGAMSNREATRPSFSEVTVTKQLDAASGGIFQQSVVGDEGVVIEFHVVQTGANSVEAYAKYFIEDVIVSSFNTSASAGAAPQETVTLSYSKIEADLSHADKKNVNAGLGRAGYDLTLAKAC